METACAVYRSRYMQMLLPYVDDAPLFAHFLDEHRCFISGSSALQFCLNNAKWKASDLDIYTSNHAYLAVQNRMYQEDYILVEEYNFYGDVSRLAHVSKFFKAGVNVDVIQSTDDLAVSPLDGFWGTLPMNAVSLRGYCISYPRLTMNELGIMHHFGMVNHQQLTLRTHNAKFKYEPRNFSFRVKPVDFNDQQLGVLRTEDLCTHTRRYYGDKMCATAVFVPLRAPTTLKTAQWIIGGDYCRVSGCTHTDPMSEESMQRIIEGNPTTFFPRCCESFSSRHIFHEDSLFSSL